MKRLALTLLLLAAGCAGARAQETNGASDAAREERRRDIRRLIDVTRGAEVGEQILHQSIGEIQKSLAFLQDDQRAKIVKVVEEEMLKEFSREKVYEAAVPIYEKHLTGEEVKGLLDFYQTPLGQRMINVLPAITREAYDDGMRRGREAGLRAMARIMEEGLLPTPGAAAGEVNKNASPTPKKRAPRKKHR